MRLGSLEGVGHPVAAQTDVSRMRPDDPVRAETGGMLVANWLTLTVISTDVKNDDRRAHNPKVAGVDIDEPPTPRRISTQTLRSARNPV